MDTYGIHVFLGLKELLTVAHATASALEAAPALSSGNNPSTLRRERTRGHDNDMQIQGSRYDRSSRLMYVKHMCMYVYV